MTLLVDYMDRRRPETQMDVEDAVMHETTERLTDGHIERLEDELRATRRVLARLMLAMDKKGLLTADELVHILPNMKIADGRR